MTKYRRFSRFFAVCLIVLVSACSNKQDLSHSQAKELIEGHTFFTLRIGNIKRQVVEITGIRAEKGIGEVKFMWKYDLTGLTEKFLKEYVGYGYSGPEQVGKLHEAEAMIKLYDNGWQLEDIAIGGQQFPY